MKRYDAVVIGSGAGAIIVENALSHGLSVALVDRGPLGGTCLNLGCIPSKMLVYPADRVVEIQQALKLGISARIDAVDFSAIMERMRKKVKDGEQHIRESIRRTDALDFYEGEGRFLDDSVLEVKGKKIRGEKIFIAAGARPLIPAGIGLESVEYLTNESVLELSELPASLIIIGGGYIAAEYGHFFSAMGTKVTIVQRNRHLLPDEEPEVSDCLLREMRKRMEIHTSTEAVQVKQEHDEYQVTGKEKTSGNLRQISGEKILVVAGRKSNADLLAVEKTGVTTDAGGYIIVDDHLRTNRDNIWAFGDIIGKAMFRHAANREASIVWENAMNNAKKTMDFLAVPHAVFTYPEVASVGMKEEEAISRFGTERIMVGRADYSEVAMGDAMMEESAFAKAVYDRKEGKILGFHIIGPYSPILIQEVTNAIALGGDLRIVARGMHIHPALTEVVVSAFGNLRQVS